MTKTFLAKNKFYSAVDIPSSADEAGASPLAPTPGAPAALSVSDGECNGSLPCRNPVKIGEIEPSVMLACTPSEAAIDSCQEPVAATLTHNPVTQAVEIRPALPVSSEPNLPADAPTAQVSAGHSDCIALLFYHARRLALPRFAPDYEAIWNAMHDKNAPRMLAGDPVWADPKPLFLKG